MSGPSNVRLPVVLCNGIACSDAYWYGVAPRLAPTRPVVRWDYRGHGRSSDPVDRGRIDVGACTEDLEAVLDDAGIGQAVLVGHSYGVQVVLETYRRRPQRVAAIVAVAGAPGRPLARGQDRETGDSLLDALQSFITGTPNLAKRAWDTVWDSPALYRLARLLGGTTVAAPAEVMQQYFQHVRNRDPQLLLDMMRAMQRHRADDIVEDLRVPLLVLAGDRDRLTPLKLLRDMALTAPRGVLAVHHGGAHTLPAEHPSWVATEIARFCTERLEAQS